MKLPTNLNLPETLLRDEETTLVLPTVTVAAPSIVNRSTENKNLLSDQQ